MLQLALAFCLSSIFVPFRYVRLSSPPIDFQVLSSIVSRPSPASYSFSSPSWLSLDCTHKLELHYLRSFDFKKKCLLRFDYADRIKFSFLSTFDILRFRCYHSKCSFNLAARFNVCRFEFLPGL
ncbi:hypothetical protein GYMLUDRAFT_877258 [Collybiopsis luxurians FD-317 M1]|nr:hypothetical protein GYMLUDRAFT_877258 [Collybiopsis luxurians FD-317 M1]